MKNRGGYTPHGPDTGLPPKGPQGGTGEVALRVSYEPCDCVTCRIRRQVLQESVAAICKQIDDEIMGLLPDIPHRSQP